MYVAYNSEIAILVINSAKGNLSLHMGFIVYNSCTHSSSKLKTIQISINRAKDKLLQVHTVEDYSGIKMNKLLIHTTIG